MVKWNNNETQQKAIFKMQFQDIFRRKVMALNAYDRKE